MIVAEYQDYFRTITQSDHADLSGQLAAKWGNNQFIRPEPYISFVTMAGVHDNGWWGWDMSPKITEDGRPMNFYQIDRDEWATGNGVGIDNYSPRDSYGGLVLNMHFTGLAQQRYGTEPSMKARTDVPVIARFVKEREAQASDLKKRLQASVEMSDYVSQEKLWHNYLLQQVMDRFSLYFCCDYPIESSSMEPVPTSWDKSTKINLDPINEGTVTVSPYPFAETPLRVAVRGRLITKRKYETDADLQEEYLNAPRRMFEFEIRKKS